MKFRFPRNASSNGSSHRIDAGRSGLRSELGIQTPLESIPILGISLASGSDYYYSAAGILASSGARSMWIRWMPDAAAPAATRCIVDCSSFGGTGAGIITEPNPLTSATDGRIVAWGGSNYAPNPVREVKIMTPTEYGANRKIRTTMVWVGADGNFHLAEGGYEIGVGGANGLTNFNTANRLGVNTRPSALGTLPYGAMTIFEIQISTLQPTSSDVLEIAQAAVGTQWSGATHLWKASPSWIIGNSGPASWLDSIGSVALTKAGTGSSIVGISRGVYSGLPSIQIMGDSIAAGRQSGGLLGNGWRRAFQQTISAAGRTCAIVGPSASSSATPDFDAQHRAVGGQGLGVPAGGIATRLSTINSDRYLDAPANGITIIAYGANDLGYRTDTLAESPSVARDNFLADITTAIDAVRVARPYGKIIIWNVLRQATGASSANARSAISLTNDALYAHLTARNDPNLSLFNACEVITSTQEKADDVNVLLDGVHPTPSSYNSLGVALANHLLELQFDSGHVGSGFVFVSSPISRFPHQGEALATNPFNTNFVSQPQIESQKEEKKADELNFQKYERSKMRFTMARSIGGSGPTHRVDEGRSGLRVQYGDSPIAAVAGPSALDTDVAVVEYWDAASLSPGLVSSWVGMKSSLTFSAIGGFEPTMALNTYNSREGVYFGGASSPAFMTCAGLTAIIDPLDKVTIVFAIHVPNSHYGTFLSYANTSTSDDSFLVFSEGSSNGLESYVRGVGAVPNDRGHVGCYSPGQYVNPKIGSIKLNITTPSGVDSIRENGVDGSFTVFLSNNAGSTSFGSWTMHLGAIASGAPTWFSGTIGAFAILSGSISNERLLAIEQSLGNLVNVSF